MSFVFPRVNVAINYTLEYFGRTRIIPHLRQLSGIEDYYKLYETYLNFTYERQKDMDDEIHQTINSCMPNTVIELLEYLKAILTDWRFTNFTKKNIEAVVDEYNERINKDFEDKVKDEVQRFLDTNPYKRKHLEVYKIDFSGRSIIYGTMPYEKSILPRINYHYYCIEEKIHFINPDFIDNYIEIMNPIINNFKRILLKWIKLYDTKKIIFNHTLLVNPQQQLETSVEEKPRKKLKVNISAGKLTFLFKMLYDKKLGVINARSQAEICRFIKDNFETTLKEDDEDLNEKYLKNLFAEPERLDAEYWTSLLDEMKKIIEKV